MITIIKDNPKQNRNSKAKNNYETENIEKINNNKLKKKVLHEYLSVLCNSVGQCFANDKNVQ